MAYDFSTIARFGLDSLMGDLIPMEDGQFVRLADVEALLRAPADIDYSIKKGDAVYHKRWSLTPLEVVDVNWALRAIAVRLGPTGGIVVWSAAGISKTPRDDDDDDDDHVATEDLAGAVWDGPNTASQVDPCMALPSKR